MFDKNLNAGMGGPQSKEESKSIADCNDEPPKVEITETSKLLMGLGFVSLCHKLYSDENLELEGDNVLSYHPPTKKQALGDS